MLSLSVRNLCHGAIDSLQLVHAAQLPAQACSMPSVRAGVTGWAQRYGNVPQPLLWLMDMARPWRVAHHACKGCYALYVAALCSGGCGLVLGFHACPCKS